jgi:hypothetical protein
MARRRLDLPTAADLVRACWELALARRNLKRLDPKRLATAGKKVPDERAVDRITFAVRAMAARVPWRADCLVQALAAQHWLARRGIGTRIHLGVKASEKPIDAHAWLKVGDNVVLGGNIAEYSEFPLAGDAEPISARKRH